MEDLQRKVRDLTQYQEQLEREKESLQSKLEQTKQKLSDVQDEAQQNQLVYGRDQALNQQSVSITLCLINSGIYRSNFCKEKFKKCKASSKRKLKCMRPSVVSIIFKFNSYLHLFNNYRIHSTRAL